MHQLVNLKQVIKKEDAFFVGFVKLMDFVDTILLMFWIRMLLAWKRKLYWFYLRQSVEAVPKNKMSTILTNYQKLIWLESYTNEM